jgi:hypothetical protein
MDAWISATLDILLIIALGAGIAQATRLIKQLQTLRASRVEMERFVREFNGTVLRAEAGIKELKMAARDSGDDLEKLIERARAVCDDLHFIIESGDMLADRLSTRSAPASPPVSAPAMPKGNAASSTAGPAKAAPAASANAAKAPPPIVPGFTGGQAAVKTPQPASRAEQELLQALQKLS